MEKRTKLRLIELVVFIIITFGISLLCSSIQYGDRIIGFTPYLGLYVGHMSLVIIISLAICFAHSRHLAKVSCSFFTIIAIDKVIIKSPNVIYERNKS